MYGVYQYNAMRALGATSHLMQCFIHPHPCSSTPNQQKPCSAPARPSAHCAMCRRPCKCQSPGIGLAREAHHLSLTSDEMQLLPLECLVVLFT
ncbi:hypothetical protein Micbo1qcDRAFT_46118 [Microdochium bolleyi]|uniref:Uncharacterized protein n=1 Tax=Microdochium bolleyi TaxID=196109 RepID=A0A136JC48_9PEZI|nr:hypothetical protein Micbo1qcDRAFT_46118 [Microdochium bolleyi]